ncbi:MAG: twin-arginine translocation signal domain-containing protein [Castellaniella sp.]|uniref:substrate-binding domain-containing protein n=1 Tax=Castellaniella sp. TaxID=1955812 RepID=UPI00120878C6|nr:substrate-binding domain-containing protein [Castellaniella sp.]TAN29989.1 MAG: twin-arginine translocation signal domain-containing protein [Castellaniella sp.]
MERRTFIKMGGYAALAAGLGVPSLAAAAGKNIVYLTPGLDLPFWRYLSKGIEDTVKAKGYGFQVLDSHNSAQTQLQNAQDSIGRKIAGLVLSPTDSSTAPSVLALAQRAKVPVVIGDIGTNSGDYASFIVSDNYKGAYGVGEGLAAALKKKGWLGDSVGIIAISQARKNGQARTKGFLDGLKAGGFTGKQAGMQQMQSYTAQETFTFTQDMLTANPGMRGLFVQTDQPSIGALRAIKAARRQGQVLLAAFDGIPEFIDLIKSGQIVVDGMQQPYLMGVTSGKALLEVLDGKTPEKDIQVPVLAVTSENIEQQLPTIRKTVFASEV